MCLNTPSQRIVIGCCLILIALVTGCYNEPDFSLAPEISYEEVNRFRIQGNSTVIGQQTRDSVVITVAFKDGDGDLGNDSPLDSATINTYLSDGGWGNYRIRTFLLKKGQFVEQPTGENNFLVFPRLTKEGQRGPIEGTLEFRSIYYDRLGYKLYPTKYRIQLRDRALRVSNEIETDTLWLPWSKR